MAPFVAASYGEPGLALFVRLSAVAILLEVAGAPIVGLMRREMAFGRAMIVYATTAFTSAAVTLTLAMLGFSYISFAWGLLAGSTAGAVLAMVLGGKTWMYRPILRNWRGMLEFGGYNGLIVVLSRLYEQLPYLVLGRILSFDAVALFNRGLMVCMIPDKILLGGATAIILPAFSAEARRNGDLKATYLTATAYMTSFQWPALVVLAILAHPVVLLVLGDHWLEVVPLVRVIAIASMLSFTFETTYAALVASGGIRDAFLRAVIIWPVSAVVLLSAAFFGLKAMVFSLLIVNPFQAVVSLALMGRRVSMTPGDVARAVWKSAAVALTSAAGPLLVVLVSGGFDFGLGGMAVALVLAASGWLFGSWAIGHPVFDEVKRLFGVMTRAVQVRGQIEPAQVVAVELERTRNG